MKIQLWAGHGVRERGLLEFAEEKLLAAFERLCDHVRSVSLRFTDENGPRGGVDHRCVAIVRLTNGNVLHVQTQGPSAHSAVAEVVHRLKGQVTRRLQRTVNARRHPRRGPGTW